MKLVFTICLFSGIVLSTHSQDARYEFFYNNSLFASNWDRLSAKQRFEALNFTTPTYREEALELVLAEANKVAQELKLPERLPITKTNLVAVFIGRPITETKAEGIGNVTTTNYCYAVSAGNKFSSVVRTHYGEELSWLIGKYHWPLWRINTNAAYQLATQWMTAVSIDVNGLNHDCRLSVEPLIFDDIAAKYFVPIYHVRWEVKAYDSPTADVGNKGDWQLVASVELFLPTKTLRDMTVKESKYILREPLFVKNTDFMSNMVFLVLQTNAPAQTNSPLKP